MYSHVLFNHEVRLMSNASNNSRFCEHNVHEPIAKFHGFNFYDALVRSIYNQNVALLNKVSSVGGGGGGGASYN